MNNIYFWTQITLMISVAVGIAGIILVFFGILRRNSKIWVTGIIILICFIALLFGGAFLGIKSVNKLMEDPRLQNITNRPESVEFAYPFSVETFIFANPPDSSLTGGISGYVIDDTTYIITKVFPSVHLTKKGLVVKKIKSLRDYNIMDQKNICLTIKFKKDFSGKLALSAFDKNHAIISSNHIEFSQEKGTRVNIVFLFPQEVPFSKINYCTLTDQY